MSIEEVRKTNKDWECELLDWTNNKISYWSYEPFSEGYWNEKYKTVFCNEEAYGNSGANCVLTLDKFKGWLELGNRTSKFSALFLYCLYKQLHNISITEKQLRDLYYNNNELLDGIRNTTYMNLRKEEKWKEGTSEDKEGIRSSLVSGMKYFENDEDDRHNKWNRGYTLDFIDALEADIFIITGETGWDVLKKIYTEIIELDKLPMNGMYKIKNTLYVSIFHPRSSNFSYNYIVEKTGAIYDELQKQPN